MQSQASTFKDLEEAEYFVAETIHKNQSKIQEWLRTTKTRIEHFEHFFSQPTGRLVNDRQKDPIDVYGVRIVLAHAALKDMPMGYSIRTAYPIESNNPKIRNNYPMVGCLFGAYFNQDWDSEYEGPMDVVTGFAREAGENEVVATITELKTLMKENHTKEEWYQLISVDLGCSFSLRLHDFHPLGWLEITIAKLEFELSCLKYESSPQKKKKRFLIF